MKVLTVIANPYRVPVVDAQTRRGYLEHAYRLGKELEVGLEPGANDGPDRRPPAASDADKGEDHASV